MGCYRLNPNREHQSRTRKRCLEEQRRLFYVGITRVKAIPSSNRPGSLLLTGSRTMTLADANAIRDTACGGEQSHSIPTIKSLYPRAW